MTMIASTLKVLAIVAGAASAVVFLPSPESESSSPEAKPAKISGVLHPASFGETGRSPVPMVRLPKAPSTEIAVAEPPAQLPPQPTATPLARESSARSAIERDGYRGVSGLSCNEGRCTGKALRGETEISVTVDPDGRVRAN